jgi:hypothetical protein
VYGAVLAGVMCEFVGVSQHATNGVSKLAGWRSLAGLVTVHSHPAPRRELG